MSKAFDFQIALEEMHKLHLFRVRKKQSSTQYSMV